MSKNTTITFIIILLILIVGLGHYLHDTDPEDTTVKDQTSQTANPVKITSPVGGSKLVKGQTYTLAWTGGEPGETQIFLIDTSLESVGTSVSISDRVYHIQNTGSYRYTVPERLPDGIYKFEIGTGTSDTFSIISPAATASTN